MNSAPDDAGRAQRRAEADDLLVSIAALGTLSTGRLELEELLSQVAALAVRAIPGADGAGLTLFEDDRPDTVVPTAPFVREVDDIQYGIAEGPCVSAAAKGLTMRSGSLADDLRWPQFGPRVAGLGVHSAVSLPLLTPTGVVGALNVYAHAEQAFDRRAAELGELFAAPAAIAVQNAHVLAQAQRLTVSLQQALAARAVVDRAIGIMMSRSGQTEEQSLAQLQALAERDERQLVVVAQTILDEAVRRARARRRSEADSG